MNLKIIFLCINTVTAAGKSHVAPMIDRCEQHLSCDVCLVSWYYPTCTLTLLAHGLSLITLLIYQHTIISVTSRWVPLFHSWHIRVICDVFNILLRDTLANNIICRSSSRLSSLHLTLGTKSNHIIPKHQGWTQSSPPTQGVREASWRFGWSRR